MKYFVFLLSLYFASLAFIPCQDSEDMPIGKTPASIEHSETADQQKHQDSCPPFCSCYCCSTARQLTAVINVSIFSKAVIRLYPAYAILPTFKQPIKIWQPPQIA